MVEYSECLKSWIPDRPLLAGVFRLAEEVDRVCKSMLVDNSMAVDNAKEDVHICVESCNSNAY
jgi:hypothetical protein